MCYSQSAMFNLFCELKCQEVTKIKQVGFSWSCDLNMAASKRWCTPCELEQPFYRLSHSCYFKQVMLLLLCFRLQIITFIWHENSVTEYIKYFSFDFELKCILEVSEGFSGCFHDIQPYTQLRFYARISPPQYAFLISREYYFPFLVLWDLWCKMEAGRMDMHLNQEALTVQKTGMDIIDSFIRVGHAQKVRRWGPYWWDHLTPLIYSVILQKPFSSSEPRAVVTLTEMIHRNSLFVVSFGSNLAQSV